MARHGISGMMAAGLISGFTILITYPHLRSSLRRLSEWLMKKSVKPIEVNIEETIIPDSSPPKDTIDQESHQNLDNTNDVSEDSKESDTSSTCSRDEEDIPPKIIKINKTSIVPNNLPENCKAVIQKLETFNIFTETVTYEPKNERNISDKTVYCKNLFLKDRKGTFYYFITHEDRNVPLRQLKYKLHAHRNFSFASSSEVTEQLNIEPGCITPFVFLSEVVSENIKIAISRDLMFEKNLNFHPLHAQYATRISFGLLLKLFGHLNRKLCIVDL